jgi:hypothetical protein
VIGIAPCPDTGAAGRLGVGDGVEGSFEDVGRPTQEAGIVSWNRREVEA